MKKIFIITAMLGLSSLNAQNRNIGINTTDPKSTLDVNLPSGYTNGQLAGVSIPQLTGDQIEAMSASTPKVGTFIYATSASTAATKDVTAAGYWYWKNAADKWEPLIVGTSAGGNTNGSGWDLVGNSGTTPANYVGTKDPQPLNFKTNAASDNSTKMTITSAGDVGIGTATPASKLDVNGTASVGYLQVKPQDATNEGGEVLLQGSGTNANVHIDNIGGNWRIFDSKTLAPRIFAQMATGNVGIGTITPASTLDVNLPSGYTKGQLAGVTIPQLTGDQVEAMSATAGLKTGTIVYATSVSTAATKDVTAVGYWYWKDAADKWEPFTLGTSAGGNASGWNLDGNSGTTAANYVGTKDAQPLNFKTNATADANPKMTITTDGRVGIGTTAPESTLDLRGVATASVFGARSPQDNQTHDMWFGATNTIGDGKYWGHIGGNTDTTDNIRRLAFYSNTNYFQGNVGIGTLAPTQKLDVNGNGIMNYLQVRPQNITTEGGEIQLIGSASYPAIQIDNWSGYARVFGQTGMQIHSGLQVFSLPAGTGDQNVLTADANGNLNKIASANYISSMSEPWQVVGGTTKATANTQAIYQNARVGVNMGTTSLWAQGGLNAVGGIRTSKGVPVNDAAQSGFSFEEDGDTGMFASGGSISGGSDIKFYNDATSTMTIKNDGRVGIGTDTPVYKLDVAGDVINNGWYRSRGVTGWYNETYGGGWYMGDNLWVRAYNAKNVWTDGLLGSQNGLTVGYGGGAPNTTSGAIIAGNVGIGTNVPATKLDVAGTARFTGQTQVSLDGSGPFGTTYTLSLSEATNTTNKQARIQFHNAGASEGYIALSKDNSPRRLIFNDDQSYGLGIEVNGDSKIVGNLTVTGTIFQTSDARFKKDVGNLSNASSTIKNLRPVTYRWNDAGVNRGGEAGKQLTGFIAQELEKVLPNSVKTDKDGYKTVNYIEVIPVLTKAVQELQDENKQLKERLDKIEMLLQKKSK